ncbi:hypothetical protein LRP88_14414 [Fusarium phalaenopsidis]
MDRKDADNEETATEHAASIPEFLAWGRRKDLNCPSAISPDLVPQSSSNAHDAIYEETEGLDSYDECTSLPIIQLLLPSPQQVWQLIDYHEECLLWYHCSISAPAFRAQLETFSTRHRGIITSRGVNLQWVALLFSVMTAGLVCAPQDRVRSWGYRDSERETLCKRWFQAVTSCLNRAHYTSNISIFSCQAVATNTVSAHILGFSNSQSIHLAAAVRIAQSLSLHRLGDEASRINTMDREIGRRVWCQLCYQGWFSIPFSESYLINPVYSTSGPPANCHDVDMLPLPPNFPTITSYCRFLYDIASFMPQLQDGLMASNATYTRYKQVLSWDAHLRNLATTERPAFFTNAPLQHGWPCWLPWARRALAISFSHKIIMIHRSFLSESFTNSAFAFTRRTCLAASKTIIKKYKCVVEEDGPVLWIHQAFSVAGCIILVLDILHRNPYGRECAEHHQLIEDALDILRLHRNSMIAARGIKLVEALVAEVFKSRDEGTTNGGRKRKRDEPSSYTHISRRTHKNLAKFDVPRFVQAFCKDISRYDNLPESRAAESPTDDPPPGYDDGIIQGGDLVEMSQFDLNFSFPHLGPDNTSDFENLLYLANSDLLANPQGHI